MSCWCWLNTRARGAVKSYRSASQSSGDGLEASERSGFRKANLVKLDLLIHGKRVDALSVIVHRDSAQEMGKKMCANAKEIIPRHQFEVSVQAAIGQKIVARANVKPFRKDMVSGLYGGDRTRKDKKLKEQKRGKERLKQIGRVNVPPDLFLKLLKVD